MINVVKSMSLIRITFRMLRDFRHISESSVYQNVKANGKQQLQVPVQTLIFSLFSPENFFQSKINNCGNKGKFMQNVEKRKNTNKTIFFIRGEFT